jgi:hypothetical protein
MQRTSPQWLNLKQFSIKASNLVVCGIFDSQICNFFKMFLRLRLVLEF